MAIQRSAGESVVMMKSDQRSWTDLPVTIKGFLYSHSGKCVSDKFCSLLERICAKLVLLAVLQNKFLLSQKEILPLNPKEACSICMVSSGWL